MRRWWIIGLMAVLLIVQTWSANVERRNWSTLVGVLERRNAELQDRLTPRYVDSTFHSAPDTTRLIPFSTIRKTRDPYMVATLAGDTLFVGMLTCTVPSQQRSVGGCLGNGVPDSGVSYARIQLRADHPDSVWRDGWIVGMSQSGGKRITFPITGIRRTVWARIAPVDTLGNQSCWSDSVPLSPRIIVP